MPISYPLPVRVAAGLVVTGVDLAKRFPSELPSMAITAAGQAMRLSMKVQQNIADLAVKGDEVLSRIGGGPVDHPAWATFDDELASDATAVRSDPRTGDDGVAGSNGVVAGDLGRATANSDAGAVVDLPSRSRRRATSTGPGNTRPSKATSTRTRGATAAADESEQGVTPVTPEPSAPSDSTPGASADDSVTAESASAEAPLPDLDGLTLAELRGLLRRLTPEQVTELVEQERAGAARAPFLTLLENRLTSLEHDAQ